MAETVKGRPLITFSFVLSRKVTPINSNSAESHVQCSFNEKKIFLTPRPLQPGSFDSILFPSPLVPGIVDLLNKV